MNFELLEKIHQIHQDLAVCKEVGDGDSVEILRVFRNNKIDEELLRDIHELYYHGHLHLPDYCHVFGYSKVNGLRNLFKKRNLPTLSAKSVRQLYGDKIEDKFKQTNIQKFGKEYPSQSPEVQEKWKQTNLERYGHEYGFQFSEIKDKIRSTNIARFGHPYASQSEEIQKHIKQTSLERFGCDHWFQNHDIKEKIKQTNIARFGHPYASQSPEIREKWKQTNLSKYGFEYPIQSPEIQGKTKQTNLERYGVENPSQSPEIKERVKLTNMERYGFGCSLQSPEVKEKSKQTNMERYGFEYASQSPEIRQKLSQRLKSEEVRDKFKRTRKSNDRRYAKLLDLVELEPDKAHQFVIGNYPGNHSTILKRYGIYEENFSLLEVAIREILENHNIEYLFRYRPKFMDGKELDFFIPNKNLAIEVNGLYWHSSKFKDKYYHQDKHLRCRSEGVQLLSFTEDQILDKLEVIESMILHKLGLTPYRLYAKNCTIRELSTKEAKDFFEMNHLHGWAVGQICYALEYNGKIVHTMSFGNNRFKKSDHPELIRSASLRFHSVAGGFQRLLKYYKRSHGVNLVESYVDFNISNGQSYELASKGLGDLGNSSVRETVRETVRDNLTEPDLWFVYKGKRYRRQMFMKHNLHKIFKDFPRRGDQGYEDITVREYLRDRGVLEYYGAGNLKFLI